MKTVKIQFIHSNIPVYVVTTIILCINFNLTLDWSNSFLKFRKNQFPSFVIIFIVANKIK